MNVKGEIDSDTAIVEGFYIPLTTINLPDKNINKAKGTLNDTRDSMYLVNIYRTLNPKVAKYTSF